MTDLLIRDLPQTVADALDRRARDHGRTRDAEARAILERAVEPPLTPARTPEEIEAWMAEAARSRAETRGLDLGDSTEIIRAFRDSR